MTQYSKEPGRIKYVKGYGFLSFVRKYRKQLLDTRLDALKTASKKVVHKAAEATGEFIANKIAEAVAKSNDDKCSSNNCSNRKKRRNIKRIITSIMKIEHYEIAKLLTVSK